MSEIDKLKSRLKAFAKARDWSKFHSPKNLAMALTVETSELLEHFQWLTEEQSKNLTPDTKNKVAEEMADVLLYLIMLSDNLGIDLVDSANQKLQENADKYPVDKAYGNSKKYTEL